MIILFWLLAASTITAITIDSGADFSINKDIHYTNVATERATEIAEKRK